MKGRALIKLRAASEADANSIAADVQAWLNGRGDRWLVEGTDPRVGRELGGTGWRVFADVCFETRLGADALLARIEQRWSNGPIASRVLSGSSIALHDCRHDEGLGSCSSNVVSVKP